MSSPSQEEGIVILSPTVKTYELEGKVKYVGFERTVNVIMKDEE